MKIRIQLRISAHFFLLLISPDLFAQTTTYSSQCGSLENAYGPFDYTDPGLRRSKLPIVERHHFSEDVFYLNKGLTGTNPLSDIDYTLRAFPNHHRALDAMARLHRSRGAEKLPGANYSLACYFDRARRMAPHDGFVRMIEGIHYFKLGDLSDAETSFLEALKLAPTSAEIPYNLGLLFVKKGDLDSAKRYAELAYDRGFPLQGLRETLIQHGEWSADSKSQ